MDQSLYFSNCIRSIRLYLFNSSKDRIHGEHISRLQEEIYCNLPIDSEPIFLQQIFVTKEIKIIFVPA